jgi:MinD-like ATPase involved in chromosome partitioning or flagellar assembly
MTVGVLTAITGSWEAPLVAGLDGAERVRVVRRCADLTELLSAAATGTAVAVVLSADLPRLDRQSVAHLGDLGIAVVGLAAPGDDAAAARLHNLGIHRVVPADSSPDELAGQLSLAVLEVTRPATAAGRPGIGDPPVAGAGTSGGDPAAHGTRRSRGLVVTVWGPVGAPGRTTLAVTLATELAAAGHQVLLADADTYGAGIAQSLGMLDESAGIAAAARAANTGGLDGVRLASLAPVATRRLRVLTGLPQARRWPELHSAALEAVWECAREVADWTVIDAGFGLESDEELMFDLAAPRRNAATLSAIAAADAMIAVGAGEPIGLARLLSGVRDLAEVVPPGRPVTVVVNRVRDAAVGGVADQRVRAAVERYAGISDPVLIPDDRPSCDASMLAGRSLTEHAPDSPARRLPAGLARSLIAEFGPAAASGPPGRPERLRGRRRRRVRVSGN